MKSNVFSCSKLHRQTDKQNEEKEYEINDKRKVSRKCFRLMQFENVYYSVFQWICSNKFIFGKCQFVDAKGKTNFHPLRNAQLFQWVCRIRKTSESIQFSIDFDGLVLKTILCWICNFTSDRNATGDGIKMRRNFQQNRFIIQVHFNVQFDIKFKYHKSIFIQSSISL